jgi:septal ring factor EnvC (AmiA/AmiB activator)
MPAIATAILPASAPCSAKNYSIWRCNNNSNALPSTTPSSAEQTLIEQSYADEDRRAAAQQQLTDAEGQLRATMATIQASEQRLASLEATLHQRHARSAELDRERTALAAETTTQQAELHEVQIQIAAIQTQLAPREAQLRAAEAELPGYERKEQTFSQQLRDAEADASRTALQLQRASDRIDVLIERAHSEGYDLAVLTTSTQPIEGDEASLNQQLNTLRAQLQRLWTGQPLGTRRIRRGQRALYLPHRPSQRFAHCCQ